IGDYQLPVTSYPNYQLPITNYQLHFFGSYLMVFRIAINKSIDLIKGKSFMVFRNQVLAAFTGCRGVFFLWMYLMNANS
ncbi:MAG: hypothetical protein WBA89_16500, partial [Microcoleus sp.]|uniref:hypothetical protein n=1 Tax=Microcoleus sp. TaxID=44472 RepID=UPI003C70F314